jgi:hypothetical protein
MTCQVCEQPKKNKFFFEKNLKKPSFEIFLKKSILDFEAVGDDVPGRGAVH